MTTRTHDPWVLLSVPKKKSAWPTHRPARRAAAGRTSFYSWEDMYVRDFAPYPRLLMPVHADDVVV